MTKTKILAFSRTLLTLMVIFNMAFTTAFMPLIVSAAETDVSNPVSENTTKSVPDETVQINKIEQKTSDINTSTEVAETTDNNLEEVSDISTPSTPTKEDQKDGASITNDNQLNPEEVVVDNGVAVTLVAVDENASTIGDVTTPESTDNQIKTEEKSSTFSVGASSSNDKQHDVVVSCDAPNLIQNGSFEDPVMTNSANWDIYPNGTGTSWNVAWQPGSGAGRIPNIEIQKIFSAQDGDQYVELDSDFDGPTGTINNEAASVLLSQEIATTPGTVYTVKFYLSGRPGINHTDTGVTFYIDGNVLDSSFNTSTSEGNSDTYWIARNYTFTASGTTTTIGIGDTGIANSYGTFLDNVSVKNCNDTPPPSTGDGSIQICKVIVDKNGNNADGKQFPGETFSVLIKNEAGDTVENVTFSTPLVTTTFGVDGLYQQQCKTLSNLPLGAYTYNEEVTSGPTEWNKTYTEGDINNPVANPTQAWGYNSPEGDIFSNGVIYVGVRGEGIVNSKNIKLTVVNKEIVSNNQSCEALPIYARINFVPLENFGHNPKDTSKIDPFSPTNSGWANYGTGNMEPVIYMSNGEVYNPGDWFLVYDPANGGYVNDPALTNDLNVTTQHDQDDSTKGLMAQRLNGQVRVVLYGSHKQLSDPLANREMINGNVEFSDGTISGIGSVDNNSTSIYQDTEGNKLEYTTNSPNYSPSNDYVTQKSSFKFVVTTANDGAYVNYLPFSLTKDCSGGNGDTNNPPLIMVNPAEVTVNVGGTYDYANQGVSATDYEDGDITTDIVATGTVDFNTPGNYTITYNVNDSEGLAAVQKSRVVHVVDGTSGGSCNASVNLIQNGSFENPVITNTSNWDIYPNGNGTDWNVVWQPGSGNASVANIEIQKIFSAQDGDQYVELDSDFDGPTGIINNEAASSLISQTINTIPGQTYTLKFYLAARPSSDHTDTSVTVYVDGNVLDSSFNTSSGEGQTDTYWIARNYTFVADGANTTIGIGDTGIANSYGTFVDNVSVNCDDSTPPNPPVCDASVYARVILTNWSNAVDGNGNMSGTIYLGSNTNTVVSGQWFNASTVDSNDIETFADVPGLAVKRENGQLVLELHGSQGEEDLEVANGYIEFFNGNPTSLASAAGQDRLESSSQSVNPDSAYINSGKAYFNLHVNTADDRFTTKFDFVKDPSCDNGGDGGGGSSPVITVADACILNKETSYDFMAGVAASDSEDGDLIASVTNNGVTQIVFGTNGTYTVTYNVTDSNGNTATATRTMTIADDCTTDNGGGGGGGGGGTTVTSSGGGSGGGSYHKPQGEVLGAETGPTCSRFNEYHDTGDKDGEIRALQVFLNSYMNSGLVVNGEYDRATTNAVHQFQALHWDNIISPWTPPLSPNTTGREYKTTVAAIDAIINCPADPVLLEDPNTMFYITEVKNQKDFSEDQISIVAMYLDIAHMMSMIK
jgi:hypothetical protein